MKLEADSSNAKPVKKSFFARRPSLKLLLTLSMYSAILFIFFLFAVYFSIPGIVSRIVIPRLSNATEMDISYEFMSLSGDRVHISGMKIDLASKNFLSADSISFVLGKADGAIAPQLMDLKISGLQARLFIKNGKPVNPFSGMTKSDKPIAPQNSSPFSLPVVIDNCEIRNSSLILLASGTGGEITRIPFTVNARQTDGKGLFFEGKIRPFMQKISFCGEFNPSGSGSYLSFNCDQIDLSCFDHFAALKAKGLQIAGDLSANGNLDFSKKSLKLSARIDKPDIRWKNVRIGGAASLSNPAPIKLELSADENACEISFNRIRLLEPLPVFIRPGEKKSGIKIARDGRLSTLTGGLSVHIGNSKLRKNISGFHGYMPMDIDFKASLDSEMFWNFELAQRLLERDSTAVMLPDGTLLKPEKLNTRIRGEGRGNTGKVNFAIIGSASVSGASLNAEIPSFEYFGSASFGEKNAQFRSFAKLSDANMEMNGLKIGNLSLLLPLKWPDTESPLVRVKSKRYDMGFVAAQGMSFGKFKLGSIESQIYQDDGFAYIFAGAFRTPFKDAAIDFSGACKKGLNGFQGDFQMILPENSSDRTIRIRDMSEALDDIELKGLISGKGSLSFGAGRKSGNFDLSIKNASLSAPDKNAQMDGFQMDLAISDLFSFSSPPEQSIKFSKAKYGKLNFGDGSLVFQVESPKKYYIDVGDFSFCKGKLHMHSSRFQAGMGFKSVLYCDRLNLAEFINQFAAARASGEGNVNGRMPILIDKAGLQINDGFLYSTPGVGGKIAFSEAKTLTDYLAESKNQNIEIASEALKEFDYDWVKLRMQSVERDLSCKISMYGKPSHFLPFGFDENNGFFRDPDGSGVKLNGIQFDFNLLFPLQDLMQFNR